MSVGDEKSDVRLDEEHRNGKGDVLNTTSSTLTLGAAAKWFGGLLAASIMMAVGFASSSLVSSMNNDTRTEEQLRSASEARELERVERRANTEAVRGLTSAIDKLPSKAYVDETADKAKRDAVTTSQAYTDQQVAKVREESVQVARDVSWIREKQDEQSRELKEGFRAIEKKLSDLPRVGPAQ